VSRVDLARHVGAQRGGDLAEAGRVERVARDPVGRPQRGGGVGAATTQAGGNRDALVDADVQGRQRGNLRSEGGRGGGGQVGPGDALALDLVRRGAARADVELIGQVERGEDRADRVQAVRPRPADVQDEVELRIGRLADR